jgi:hypothetical protein
MKKLIMLSLCVFGLTIGVVAQSNNLVVFTKDAQPFYLAVNGVHQNETPSTNVKVRGVSTDQVDMRVIFVDESIPQLRESFRLMSTGKQLTYEIVNRNGGYVLNYVGETDISIVNPVRPNVDQIEVDFQIEGEPAPAPTPGNPVAKPIEKKRRI